MATHTLWLEIILNPNLLDQKYIDDIAECQKYDLLVHLINNGIALLARLTTPLQTSTGVNVELLRKIETQKYNIIRFLVFKLLSHFRWDLQKILDSLPSVHQEFVITEFKRFCEQEMVPEEWKNFAFVLYHRWVLRFVLKSIQPIKPAKIGIISSNQQLLDPYFVSPEVQDNLNKKFQNICLNSLAEIEKIVVEFNNGRTFDIAMPLFDSFTMDKENLQLSKFAYEKAEKFEKSAFMDDIYYELGRWYFVHEDYAKSNAYFGKIVQTANDAYQHLDGYRSASLAMTNSKDYRYTEPKESDSGDKRIGKYLQALIKDRTNLYDIDLGKFGDAKECKKILQTLKKFADTVRGTKEEAFLFDRLVKYLIFKVNGLHEALDANTRAMFLGAEQGASGGGNSGKNNMSQDGADEDGEVIEEGEINADEELGADDTDPELMLLEATEPEQILALISRVHAKRGPLSINSKWVLPENQMLLIGQMSPADYFKCHVILAKANELRDAKYFIESRVLYLSLMEDVQASNPHLADVIQYELLRTDLETFRDTNDVDERVMMELEMKCVQRLRSLDTVRYQCFHQTIESMALFLVDHRTAAMKEFLGSPIELLRFCACLACLGSGELAPRESEKRAKELWEFCLTAFVPSNCKFAITFPRITFYSSFDDFIGKLQNGKVMAIVAMCLAKMYNMAKDNPSAMIAIAPQADYFPPTMPQNLLSSIDLRAVGLTLDRTLRGYLRTNPNDLQLLRYYGDYLLAESLYFPAMTQFVRIVMLNTNFFTTFDYLDADDVIVQQMIIASAKMGAHVQAAVLYQLTREPDYGLAFKELSGPLSADSSDDLYECVWDVTLLEYLINFHYRRGDDERRNKVTRLVSQLDLNFNNNEAVQREAANLRKSKLFRMLARQYM